MPAIPGHPGQYHGECLVRMLAPNEIAALPWDEQRKLTLADTGIDLMKFLLAFKEAR